MVTAALSRRDFVKLGLTATAALGLRATAAPAAKYVDIHTHLTQPWGGKPALDAKALLSWMDEKEIAQAVVLPLISPESWDHPITTGYVLDQTRDHRDRLIPFCSVDPRTANLSYQGKLDLLRKYQEAGARGFGEHKAGVAMDAPENIEIFHACAELRFPVLFHLDNVRNIDHPGLPGLEKVLQSCPETIFIGHATGWWASISGDAVQDDLDGYPEKPVAPGGVLDVLFEKYPNIYGDLSAGSGANAIARDKEFGREFLIRRAERLLFGTDYLAPGQDVPQFQLFAELNLPDAVQERIFRANARRLLSLSLQV